MRKLQYSYESAKFRIEAIDGEYILLRFMAGVEILKTDVTTVNERVRWIAGHKPYCLLIDISNSPVFSEEVQQYAASLDNDARKLAEAVIVNSGWQARMGNLYRMYLRKKHYEQRFFMKPEKAIAWLKNKNKKA